MPDTLERREHAADERPAGSGASADSDTGDAKGASLEAHALGLVVVLSDASAASASEDEQLRARLVSWMEALDVPETISQLRFVPLSEVNVVQLPAWDATAKVAVAAGSSASAVTTRGPAMLGGIAPPAGDEHVDASPDPASVGAVAAESAATSEAPRAGATDAAVVPAESTSGAITEEDGSLVFVMDGRPTRISASDATHWARYRDAPDDEWETWQVDLVTRKRVRR